MAGIKEESVSDSPMKDEYVIKWRLSENRPSVIPVSIVQRKNIPVRVKPPIKRGKVDYTALEVAQTDANRLKLAIEDDGRAIIQVRGSITEVETHIKRLQDTLEVMKHNESSLLKCLPAKPKQIRRKPVSTVHPEDTVLENMLQQQLDLMSVHQKDISKSIMCKIQALEAMKKKKEEIFQQREHHYESLKDANTRIIAAQEALKEDQKVLLRCFKKKAPKT